MNLRRYVLIAMAGLLLVTTAAAQGTFDYPMSADPEHLDPWRSTTTATRRVIINVYEGLTTLDGQTAEVIPSLATSWDISDDGLTYTFHLREGVLFQEVEGVNYEDREMKAADVEWSFLRYLSEDTDISQHPEYLIDVEGAQAYLDGEADGVSGMRVVDDYTIEITLTAPSHRFLATLINVYVVPQEALDALGADFSNSPVGTGPFIFDHWNRDDELVLNANPDYYEAGFPVIDTVRFVNVPEATTELLLYREGDVDVLLNFPAGQLIALQQEFAEQYFEKPGLNVRYWGFKMDEPPFQDNLALRQAFNYAVDNALIWDVLMEGGRVPASETLGVLPPDMPAAEVTGYGYDPERAKELLAEAGYPGGEGLEPITLYYYASAEDAPNVAFQDMLAQIGVTIEVQSEDNSTYWTHVGEPDVKLFLSGWSADLADASEVFDFLFAHGRDDTHYDNPEVNALLDQARATADVAERTAIYKQAHQLIMDDAPWIATGYSKISYLLQPGIENFQVSAAGTYRTPLKYVTLP